MIEFVSRHRRYCAETPAVKEVTRKTSYFTSRRRIGKKYTLKIYVERPSKLNFKVYKYTSLIST